MGVHLLFLKLQEPGEVYFLIVCQVIYRLIYSVPNFLNTMSPFVQLLNNCVIIVYLNASMAVSVTGWVMAPGPKSCKNEGLVAYL